jgi:hypothetical protein
VADFYAELMRVLAEFGIDQLPNEISDAIRFSEDHVHAAYDREYAERFWRILVQSARALGVPHFFHRQMQSGPFLLGKFRSRGDPLLRTPRAAVSSERRRAESSRGGDARRLFARGEQRGVLAWRTGHRLSSLLFLRLAGAARLLLGADPSPASLLEP